MCGGFFCGSICKTSAVMRHEAPLTVRATLALKQMFYFRGSACKVKVSLTHRTCWRWAGSPPWGWEVVSASSILTCCIQNQSRSRLIHRYVRCIFLQLPPNNDPLLVCWLKDGYRHTSRARESSAMFTGWHVNPPLWDWSGHLPL